jgi:8-oxo-dGTP pyrophosphatase MutT (NUDIX family)
MNSRSVPLGLDDLARAIEEHQVKDIKALPGRTNHLPGAVLVPLELNESLACIVTVRPQGLRLHSGEVVFPGGGPEPGDADLAATALREAEEELGLQDVQILGRLSSIPLYTSDYRLHPFVGIVPDKARLCPNPAEVESVHRLSLINYLDREFIHAIAVQIPEQPAHLSPVFEIAERLMFGGTAYAFFELLGIVARILQREVPPLRADKYQLSDILPGAIDENVYSTTP